MPDFHEAGNVEDAILLLMDRTGVWMTPSNIAENVGYSRGYVRKICKSLAEDGLLDVKQDGTDPFYRITDAGREAADELPEPEPE